MMLWKKTVGENRVDCSTVMVIDRKRRVDQKTLDETDGRRVSADERSWRDGTYCWIRSER